MDASLRLTPYDSSVFGVVKASYSLYIYFFYTTFNKCGYHYLIYIYVYLHLPCLPYGNGNFMKCRDHPLFNSLLNPQHLRIASGILSAFNKYLLNLFIHSFIKKLRISSLPFWVLNIKGSLGIHSLEQ